MSGVLYAICFIWVALPVGAQEAAPDVRRLAYGADRGNVTDALDKIRSGNYGLIHISMVADARATEAIPDLKKRFITETDPDTKAKLASALMQLGVIDDVYWQYLVLEALPAIESDAPEFSSRDARGSSSGEPSPAFVEWAKAHHLSPQKATEDVVYEYPARVSFLAEAGDRRAIPLLRKALKSPNYLVQTYAAQGLAELKDEGSIPLIISACERAPKDAAELIAESLVYFPGKDAQGAAKKYISPTHLQALNAAVSSGKRPMHP